MEHVTPSTATTLGAAGQGRGTNQVNGDARTLVTNTNYLVAFWKRWQAAIHEPPMCEYLIQRSQHATHRDSPWNNQIYDTVAWEYIGDLLRKLPIGRRIQLSKYMHDLLPTAKRLQTFDNRHDG